MGVLLSLVVSLTAASPSASERHEADRLGAQAKADRLAGGFKAALGEATRAWQTYPRPVFLLEIAEDHRGLGEWAEAATYYERYLATRPAGANRALARKHFAEAKSHLRGGGDVLAVAPLAPGPAPAANPLEPAPLVAAPLAPAPLAPPPVTQAQPPPAPPAAVADPFSTGTAGEVSQSAPAHHSHVLAYTLIGVAAASAVVAVIGWGNVVSYNNFEGSVASSNAGTFAATDAVSRKNQAQTWWDVGLATTIVAAVAGGAIAFTW
ncbi:MAG TPA: hypothetical protein VMB50_02675 [Myxococcales bacterium]|nr:hypothetical protein [Myxococcales bacterium]